MIVAARHEDTATRLAHPALRSARSTVKKIPDGDPMTHSFKKDYWERHWDQAHTAADGTDESGPNPHLIRETNDLEPGTALDAGCGTGAEAIWLATRGWEVTGADISATALARAADRAAQASVSERVTWVEADLTTWAPDGPFDLVVTSYAHPAMPQLAFYERISQWVAPGGTLLIVGHLADANPADHAGHEHEQEHEHLPPAEATVTPTDITGRLDSAQWRIDSAEERTRSLGAPGGSGANLRDVIVRATRLP